MKKTIYDVLERLVICEPKALDTGCWEWSGSRSGGYGTFRRGQTLFYVHRAVYEHFVGPIPDGLELDHICRNHCCANFEHLEPVTHQENLLRGHNPLRGRTQCARGHVFSGGNLIIRKDGGRRCRVCYNEAGMIRKRRWRERMKQDGGAADQIYPDTAN